ncbi:hypothetical protein BGZ54_004549 [Gamsiella multidivaricata]|nr:hypothetical protein BGZ54_004549 [Gamsiella multidivaricata]
MANVMGGSILSSSSTVNTPLSGAVSASLNSSSSKTKKDANSASGSGTVRIFYSLQENPNAIISYADLIRLEQKRQRAAQLQTSPLSKSGATATSSASTGVTPNVTGSSSTTASLPTSSPLKNSKVTGTGAGASIKDVSQSSTTAMDIDPPEGEEALGEGDSEAEDDDEEDEEEHDEENEDGTEAEDEDDDEDPDEDDEEEDDPESGKREPKDFLEALTEKYAGLEEGNEGEDEDEDEDDDGKGQVYKRPSRWDTEHYDIEDEFIDDSEMMLESIGMVRPKIDGFFAYRGPVEITNEDPDSSDAGPRSRKPAKRKQAAASSPLNTGKGATKSSKGSSLAVMENANDSMSEMSEMDDKPKPTKNSVISGLANSTIPSNEGSAAAAGAEGGTNSATATPKKKNAPSKSKAAGKELNKDGVEAKDSDKESKAGPSKKAKSKPSKSSATSSTPAVSTPIVRIESPQPMDDNADNSTPPPEPVRASSPSRSKSKPKASATVEQDSTATGAPSENAEALVSSSTPPSLETASAVNESAKGSAKLNTVASEAGSKSKGHRTLEPLNEEVQVAYDIVADLARKETWEVKARFPPHIKAPLFECARIALATRSSGYVLEDSFFVHLQAVLPYNKFTLKKLIYKNVLPGWIADLEAQKSRLIEQFTTRANMVWKASGLADQPEKDGDGDVNMSGEEGKPQRKFPWSQDLRLLLWETMEKFMEILAARQEFRAIDENQPAPPSDSKTRKDAYQTLLLSFPSGWMTSYEISRQYSQLKEKVQKQEKREVESNSTTVPIGKPRPVFSGNIGPKSATYAACPIYGRPDGRQRKISGE